MFHKKNKLKIILLMAITIFVLLLLQSCGKNINISVKNKTIKIGIMSPITGEDSSIGNQEIMALRFANEKYNKIKIGDDEYKIKIVEKDHQSNVNEAKNVAKELVKEGVSFVICGYDENIINEVREIFVKEKVPFIISSGISTELTNGDEYSFKIGPNDVFLAPAIINYIKNIGKSSLAIFSEEDDIRNEGMISYMERAGEILGIDIVKKISVSRDGSYDINILKQIKDQEIECIYIDLKINHLANVIKSIRDYGIKSKIITTDLIENELEKNSSIIYLEDIDFYSSFDGTNFHTNTAKDFVEGSDKKGFKNYLLANGIREEVHSNSVLVYDSFLAIYYALQDALSIEKEDVLQSITNVSFESTNGILKFNEDKNTNLDLVYMKNIKNGIATIVDEINLNGK